MGITEVMLQKTLIHCKVYSYKYLQIISSTTVSIKRSDSFFHIIVFCNIIEKCHNDYMFNDFNGLVSLNCVSLQ